MRDCRYEARDLAVRDTQPEAVAITEAYLQLYERRAARRPAASAAVNTGAGSMATALNPAATASASVAAP